MALSFMVFIRIGEDRHETQPIKRILDADGEFGEERVGQIADDHADKVGGRRAKTGGAAIVDITETLHRLFDALPRFALHEGGVAQDQRHGRLRHASGARDIDHRGRPARDGFPLHQRSSPPETMAQRKSRALGSFLYTNAYGVNDGLSCLKVLLFPSEQYISITVWNDPL